MGYEAIRITDEVDRAMQRTVRSPRPAAPHSWLGRPTGAAGHFLKLLRMRAGVRPAFAKIRIDSVWAGQTLRCPFRQMRREPDERNQVRAI
jgi:hypothetical protein